ncbi:S-layer homology domain-containing protein, partial [Arthrobacter sp. CAN_A1]|uniref:S-layer homology domain-containing protein n=1 Tax=Arthrobacter sp. CAN_A1 TaxID=2787717 RepID=UPI0018C8F6E6
AAFMYRMAGSPSYTAPARSPFGDVSTNNQFYKEISWLASTGISTGYPDGTYRPLGSVNRDAMAAFMYRMAGSPSYTAPARSPFGDVSTNNQFYKEISWLASTGISTGYPDGTYRPLTLVKRDAMAAFMYRYSTRFQ